MRATVQDAIGAITVRNAAIFVGIATVSIAMINVVGYVVWRRFPIPTLILCVAVLGWKIGRKIGHAGLSKVLNAASVGLGAFGIVHWFAAIVDATYFAEIGYVSWSVHTTMWGWIAFHVWRAWRVLKEMPPDQLVHVTEGTDMVYVQMTHCQVKIKETLGEYEAAKKSNLHFVVA